MVLGEVLNRFRLVLGLLQESPCFQILNSVPNSLACGRNQLSSLNQVFSSERGSCGVRVSKSYGSQSLIESNLVYAAISYRQEYLRWQDGAF